MKNFQVKNSRCWCHPLALFVFILLLLFQFINCEEIRDFWSINTLSDGEVETRIYYHGITGKETTVDQNKSVDDIQFRQLTNNHTLIQLIYNGGVLNDCEIVHNKKEISKFLKEFKNDLKLLLTTSNITVQSLDDKNLPSHLNWLNYQTIKKSCRDLHKVLKERMQSSVRSRRDLTDFLRVPGTKWCGKGYSADKYTRLGGFSRTDKCCRRHDLGCPFWIGGFETKYNLFNWRVNTIMHCSCDERFRTCLKLVDSSDANLVGKLFFNYVQSKCFVLKPRKRCVKSTWWGQCEKYKYEKQAIIRDNLPY